MSGYVLCNGCADTGSGLFQDEELVRNSVRVVPYFAMAALTQVVDGFRTRNWCATSAAG